MQLVGSRSHKAYRAVIGSRLLVIDEIGFLSFGREQANLSVNVVAKR